MPRTDPIITINGVQLSDGEAMALRVAITAYHAQMAKPNALGNDTVGENIRKGYLSNLGRVQNIIFLNQG